MSDVRHILAADIGGSNGRFGLFSWSNKNGLKLEKAFLLSTASADSFADLVSALGNQPGFPSFTSIDRTAIAAAGPVMSGRFCYPPNINWNIDISTLHNSFSMPNSYLINDFIAQAWACSSDVAKEAELIIEAENNPIDPVAIVGAGTGLGKALLLRFKSGNFMALPSEGAHVVFPVTNDEEYDFYKFIRDRKKLPYPTWDVTVCGDGLSVLHEYLTGEQLRPEQVAEKLNGNSETLKWFSRFYGRACRDYILETLATGGLYIAGGIAAKNPIVVKHQCFRDEFLLSPTHSHILKKVTVRLINDTLSGLWGAAAFAAARD